ncbi:MAG: phage tail tape measure protein [Chitinophagaceae bacterium]|nr:phage tail tape measure protein [Chitinophagaceae bacterium]
MAKEIVNRNVSIYVEAGQAQRAYDQLIKKEKELNAELAETTNPKRMEALRNQINALQEPISRAAKKLSGELEPSLKDVQATVARLRNDLARMSESDAGYDQKVAQYRKATTELEAQRGKVGLLSAAWKSFWQEAKTVAVGVIVGNTLQAALQSVLGYVSGIVTGSAKIADELSDIEKTTGLTNTQVRELNKELGKIDTRTSRSELRKLAAEGGKLGFESAPEILKFVDAADKIRVALKEDLGEEAILDIAKASKIFGVEMLNMASAINEIGASSSASEAFSVDFIKRTGGVASTVKIAAGDILGYSSALEQAGQTTEVSATALNTFFLDFISNSDKFGKAAGFAKGELAGLIGSQGTNEGFLQWLQRLKEANPEAGAFINRLKELGIDGARGSNVMLTLANNIQTVREQQTIANKAISSNSSIMDEFNKKNTNAAANYEKLKKEIAGIFQSESFQKAGEATINIFRGFIQVLKDIPEFIRENRFALLTLVAGILLLNQSYLAAGASAIYFRVQQVLTAVATRATTAAVGIQQGAIIAYNVILLVATGRISAAAGAQTLWRVAMATSAGTIGAILVVVGAFALLLKGLLGTTKSLTAEQRLNAEIEKAAANIYADQIATIKQKIELAKNENISLETRKKALNEVKEASGGYLNALTLENIATQEGTNLINLYIESLKRSAKAKAVADLSKEKEKRKIQIETELDVLNANYDINDNTGAGAFIKDIGASLGIGKGTSGQQIRDLSNELSGLDKELTALYSKIEKDGSLQDAIINGGPGGGPGGGSTGGGSSAADKAKKDLEDLLKDLQKIRDGLTLSQLSPLDQDLKELDIKFSALRERAKGNTKLLIVIDELYAKSRVVLIQEYARKEVEAWGKSSAEIQKKADEAFKKNLEALKKIEDRISAEMEKRFDRFDRNRLAGKELAVLQANGKKRLEAQLELLKEQERAELNAKDLTENEKLLIEEKYRQKRMDAEIDFQVNRIQIGAYFLQGLADIDKIISDNQTRRENEELESDKRINDAKKRKLDERLKAGTITQMQYNREIEKMDRDRERKELQYRRRQFERDKRAQFVAALLNNAGAVTTTLQKFGPPIPPNFLGIAAMGLTILTGLTQLATIASTKAPQYGSGGKLDGRYHSQGGNPILDGSGRVIGNIEKDEGIINRFTMGDRRQYSVTGTPSQIASTLNGLHGGRIWDRSARLVPIWSTRQPAAMNFAAINKYFAAGGKFSSTGGSSSSASSDETIQMLNIMLQQVGAVLQKVDATLSEGIYAYTLVTENEKAQQRLDAIRDDATVKG